MIMALMPVLLSAQSNPLDSYIAKYSETPGFYYFDLKTNMFNPSDDEGGNDGEASIINLKMISVDDVKNPGISSSALYDKFYKGIKKNDYKGLVEVKSNGENVEMIVKKDGNYIKEMIITIQDEEETTLIVATGNFSLKDMAKFSNAKKCKGFEILGQLCED